MSAAKPSCIPLLTAVPIAFPKNDKYFGLNLAKGAHFVQPVLVCWDKLWAETDSKAESPIGRLEKKLIAVGINYGQRRIQRRKVPLEGFVDKNGVETYLRYAINGFGLPEEEREGCGNGRREPSFEM
nr:hypothetical protein [Tanacetum cinerariifolium]